MNNSLIKHSLWLAVLAGSLALASCGSDDTTEPVDTTPQAGHVYIYAGTGVPGYGKVGQVPSKTQLYWPQDIVFAPDNSPVLLDWNNHRVIAVDGSGHFKLLVGVAGGDFGDPCPDPPASCVDIDATNAKLNHPTHVAFDATGEMTLCAWHNSALFRVDLGTETMSRFCGDGTRLQYNGDDQPALTAFVDLPVGLAFDPSGNLVFSDQANQLIRMIDNTDIIHDIAGTPRLAGYTGDGGPATAATFFFEVGQVADPSGKICYDPFGNLYIADTGNQVIRIIDPSGTINTFAGSGPANAGYAGDGGPATAAQLRQPRDVASDADGNIYIADTGNHVIRMVKKSDGTISTLVGA